MGQPNHRNLFVAAAIVVLRRVAGGCIWFLMASLAPAAAHAADNPDAPTWEDVRRDVLPLAAPQQTRSAGRSDDFLRPSIDPRITEIGDNLNAQFARNPGHETGFTDAYPRRALESWVRERAGIPAEMHEAFIDALVVVSAEIGEDPMINRIGSVDERAKTIRDALTTYRDAYLLRVGPVASEDAPELAGVGAELAGVGAVGGSVLRQFAGPLAALALGLFVVAFFLRRRRRRTVR